MAIGYRSDGGYAHRNASNTTTLTVGVPSGTTAGDLMLLATTTFVSGASTVSTPSGWTLISSSLAATSAYRCQFFYKIAGASEASLGLTTDVASWLDAVIFGFTGVDGTTPIDATGAWASVITGTSVTVPSITTATANAWWVVVGADLGPGNFTAASFPSGWTLRYRATVGLTIAQFLLNTVLVAAAGATTATSYSRITGAPGATSIGIALRPGPTAIVPVADFTGTPLTGIAPLSVTFTDASTNTPTSWAWDFGDTGTSTSQNPTHSYTVPGVYTVALTATNSAGSNTKTRTGYVTVSAAFVPQIIWFTPAPLTGVPAAPTFESATAYSTVANRPAVTGTTRPFASSAALTGALNAAVPGDLVQYTGAGILDIVGNYSGFCGRRYTGYVSIDLGLPGSANHVRFTGGGGAGLPAVAIYNSAFLRIYGGEITNPPPKSAGYDGLHIYGAQNPGNGSTNHIVWWNLLVHDTVDSGIKMLPNVVSGGGNAADNTIADCDIEAEVYRIGLDKTVDFGHPELGTGQHCANLADSGPSGATYPSFLRNRVAIDGHDTGLTSSQGGGSVIELGFNDAASTISGCTLIIRGNNTMFNAQQQTGGNGLNLWGDAAINAAVPFIQHSNATGSPVNNQSGTNRPGVVVAYGRHASTNQNAYEGVVPWQIGPTYRDVA